MSCKDTMITDVAKATPSQTVQDIMDVFETKRFNSVPVVDEENHVIGMFSMHALFKNLLPISAQIEGGLDNLDFLSDSEEGVAKKIRKLRKMPISKVMEKNPPVLEEDSPAWEAVRLMAERGSPIMVVEQGTKNFLGMITTQSLLARMQNVIKAVEEEEKAGNISVD